MAGWNTVTGTPYLSSIHLFYVVTLYIPYAYVHYTVTVSVMCTYYMSTPYVIYSDLLEFGWGVYGIPLLGFLSKYGSR